MDDKTIAAIIGWPETIDENYVRRAAAEGRVSDEDADLICRAFRRKGRRGIANVIRDVRIRQVVEALIEEGLGFRAASKRVAPFVHLSPSGVRSVVRKERLRV